MSASYFLLAGVALQESVVSSLRCLPIFMVAQILVSTDLGPRAHLAATACLHSLTGDHSQQSTSDWFCDSWQEFARNPIEVTVVVFLQFPM